MAEKKRSTLVQRIGMGVFLGILGVGVGLGVYDGFDAKKEKTPVVRDVEVKEKTVHNKGKNDPPSTLVEAVHKDKNGRVLIRVLGKDKEEAERLLSERLELKKARESKMDAEYKKSMERAEKIGKIEDVTEVEFYSILQKDVYNVFSIKIGSSRSEMYKGLSDLSGFSRIGNTPNFGKTIGSFRVTVSGDFDKSDKLESYSMIVTGNDSGMLLRASRLSLDVLSRIRMSSYESVALGNKEVEAKKAFVIAKSRVFNVKETSSN